MTNFDYSPLYRSLIGFDQMRPWFENAARHSEAETAYPPYNIEKIGADQYRITMAVAGFDLDDLTIEAQGNTLLIKGERRGAEGERHDYLHRGIAGDRFVRTFQLADYVKVKAAHLDNGLLSVDLVRELPEEMKPRKIEIGRGGPKKLFGRFNKLVEGKSEAA